MVIKRETVTLEKDCEGHLVPVGTPVQLKAGQEVQVTQSLGGNVTVNVNGNLVQIPAPEAHALGDAYRWEPPEEASDAPLKEQVWEMLRTCYDPEIPVNIVDLGLVYDCRIATLLDGRTRVDVQMTLTAPGCGMGPLMAEDVKKKLLTLDGVDEAGVELVFDPPWGRDMMTEAAQLELGLL
jgi:probable FeS assembly SUF system protein SufT